MDTAYKIESNHSNQDSIFSKNLIEKAKHVLETTDFPTSRTEAWKYTRVAKIKNTDFKTSRFQDFKTLNLSKFLIPDLEGSVLVFVNGFFSSDLSKIENEEGLEISPISERTKFSDTFLGNLVPLENEIFSAINTIYATDGVCVRIKEKTI